MLKILKSLNLLNLQQFIVMCSRESRLEANLLDHVFHHKKLQKRVETYLRLVDLSRLILGMIHHTQEYFVLKGRNQELQRLAE